MNSIAHKKMTGLRLIVTLCLLLGFSTQSFAADDPSIRGKLRDNIQAEMKTFIDNNTVNGVYSIYDPVDGRLIRLSLKELHSGIVKKGDFYVSCADFLDPQGQKVDLDFLVVPDGDRLVVTQAVVHAVDGKKRKYHLEG